MLKCGCPVRGINATTCNSKVPRVLHCAAALCTFIVRVLLASRLRHSCSDICLALAMSHCSVNLKLASHVRHCEPQRGVTSSAISQRSYPMLGRKLILVHSSMRTESRKCNVQQGTGKYQDQSDLQVGSWVLLAETGCSGPSNDL